MRIFLSKNKHVVCLIDYGTISAGVDMAAYAQALGIKLIETNTHGSTGQLAVFDLKDGGITAFSCARVLTSDNQEIWNQGVLPNQVIEQSYNDYQNGID